MEAAGHGVCEFGDHEGPEGAEGVVGEEDGHAVLT